jgi:RuvB-like protein 1
MLDLESITYLNRALESPIAPIVILASNRGMASPRLSSEHNTTSDLPPTPHGLPSDLLARLLIIPTHPYTATEISQIVAIRAKVEGLTLSEDAMKKATELGTKVSLRYACSLLSPSRVLAKVSGRPEGRVERADLEEAEGLFWDVGRSVREVGKGESGWVQ